MSSYKGKLRARRGEANHVSVATKAITVITLLLAGLSTLERDRLKDTLAIVKRFRQQLQQQFRLGAL